MYISLNWLKDYVNIPEITPQDFGLKVTMSTAEIEGFEEKGDDIIYDFDNKSLTHRPDLWGHYGFAREIAAIFKTDLKPLNLSADTADNHYDLNIRVEDFDLCPRYNALVIDGVTIGPSPQWLQDRLEAVGTRAINNVVDITNYILQEIGQPLHAFDASFIEGNEIIIRRAQEGETMSTLDDIERELNPEMLVIADKNRAVALAGVMGGANSEVNDSTTTIILESANFHPGNIRRTSAKLGLRTDASIRFEKGLDPQQTSLAVKRFYTLLKDICPECKIISKLHDVKTPFLRQPIIYTSIDFINRKLGTTLSQEEIIDILTRLHFEVTIVGNKIKVKVPTFRATGDVSIPEDLVEEVGRIFGYDNITPESPLVTIQPVRLQPHQQLIRNIRQLLSGELGMSEVFNYSFVGDELLEKTGLSNQDHIALANPLSSEHHLLRQSLIPNMLKITAENLRYRKNFAVYELERIFMEQVQSDSNIEYERFSLCGLICRSSLKATEEAFFELKGMLESFFPQLEKGPIQFEPLSPDQCPAWGHPGRTAGLKIKGTPLGHLAQLHPQIAHNFGIKATIALFTVDISLLLNLDDQKSGFKPISRYPVVPFDISLICDFKTHIQDAKNTILNSAPDRVQSVELFDVYTGENIDENQKSLAFKVTFASDQHTLGPDEITTLQNGVIEALEDQNYIVRKG